MCWSFGCIINGYERQMSLKLFWYSLQLIIIYHPLDVEKNLIEIWFQFDSVTAYEMISTKMIFVMLVSYYVSHSHATDCSSIILFIFFWTRQVAVSWADTSRIPIHTHHYHIKEFFFIQ